MPLSKIHFIQSLVGWPILLDHRRCRRTCFMLRPVEPWSSFRVLLRRDGSGHIASAQRPTHILRIAHRLRLYSGGADLAIAFTLIMCTQQRRSDVRFHQDRRGGSGARHCPAHLISVRRTDLVRRSSIVHASHLGWSPGWKRWSSKLPVDVRWGGHGWGSCAWR